MSKEKISIPEIIEWMIKDNKTTKKTAEEFIKVFLSTIEDALLSGESVKVKGFGTFKLQWYEARRSIDVNTGNEIIIPGFYRTVFVPENELRDVINEPFAHLEAVPLPSDEEDVKETEKLGNDDSESDEKTDQDQGLRFFTSQASEIKSILSDIYAMSAKKNNQEDESEVLDDDVDFEDDEYDDDVEEIDDFEDDYVEKEQFAIEESDDDFDIIREVAVLYPADSNAIVVDEEAKMEDEKEVDISEDDELKEIKEDQAINAEKSDEEILVEQEIDKKNDAENEISGSQISETEGITSDKLGKDVTEDVINDDNLMFDDDEKSARKIPAWLLVLLSLVILGVLIGWFASSHIKKTIRTKKNGQRQEYIADSLAKGISARENGDSLVMLQKDTAIDSISASGAAVSDSDIYATPRNYTEFLAVEKMVPGSQLTRFARQYYNHPNFWVYIYEANKEQIADPDNVPVNIDVKIPKMDPRLIDPKNKVSMEYALKLQREYLK